MWLGSLERRSREPNQLMIMSLVSLPRHQTHDHESVRAASSADWRWFAGPPPERAPGPANSGLAGVTPVIMDSGRPGPGLGQNASTALRASESRTPHPMSSSVRSAGDLS